MRFVLALLIACCAGQALADGEGIGIAAVVDDQVISTVDVSDRMVLMMSTANIPDSAENRARIAPQVLRQLIDEKLQMEEAARDDITISDTKLHEGLAQIEKQNGQPAGSLEQFLATRHLSKLSLYTQVRAQMAWADIVLKKIRPRIKISDQEVARYIRRKEAPVHHQNQGRIEEVLISAIHLPVDAPKYEGGVRKLADKLAGQIRAGSKFEAVASQFSSSTGGTKATAPFWVEMSQLDPAIAGALLRTTKGGVTDPVRTAAGYQIIKLVDVREAKSLPPAESAENTPAADENQPRAELAFKQILMQLKPDAKAKEAELLLTLAREVQKSPGKCADKSMAGAGDLADLDFRVTLTRAISTELPEKLRDFLMNMKVGSASDPIVTPQGIRIFMLCERIDLPTGAAKVAGGPVAPGSAEDDATRQAIYQEKIELEAQKYMRDLRRAAFIEIRGQQGEAN